MLAGKKFKLERATLAITVVEGRREELTSPVGAIIKVVSAPTIDGERMVRMVDVLWDGQTVEMFALDVSGHGTEIGEPDRHELGTQT